MKDGESSPQATAALESMHAEYHTVEPVGASQTEAYSHALDDLTEIGSMRRERLNIAAADLPTMLRVLVVVGVFLLLVLEYRPELSRIGGLVFMGTLAMVVTSAFLLTVVLNYPFAGEVSVSNAPLKEDNLARFWSEELAYQPQPGDEEKPLTAETLAGRLQLRRLRNPRPPLLRRASSLRGPRLRAGRQPDARRVPLPRRHHKRRGRRRRLPRLVDGGARRATAPPTIPARSSCGSWRRRTDRSSPAIGATATGRWNPAGISRRLAATRRRTWPGAWRIRTASSRPRPHPEPAPQGARAACPFGSSAGPAVMGPDAGWCCCTISIARSTSGTASAETTCQLHWCVVWFQSSSRSG